MSYPYETLHPTDQAKLSRLDGPSRVPFDLPTRVQRLKALGISMDFEEIQRTLREVVPEYQPMTPLQRDRRGTSHRQRGVICRPPRSISRNASRCRRTPLPLVAALAAAFIWTYWLVIPGLVAQWWNEDEYSHGFLIPLVSGYLVWTKRDELKATAIKPTPWGLAVMAVGPGRLRRRHRRGRSVSPARSRGRHDRRRHPLRRWLCRSCASWRFRSPFCC